ncbi:hypothetical protein ElyMa_003626500 [Elysia marginata]|uniref:F5/8 type C domain-containing protein n=1 Tax=Elysia marginata TaxID=1093978 RepID=A0AAV4ETV5_9GAST|nr:hypothetical protein ElyMa_003626500 [Elysia marginata]
MRASLVFGLLVAVTLCSMVRAEYHVAQGSYSVKEVGKVEPEPTWEMHEEGHVNGWQVVNERPIDGMQ